MPVITSRHGSHMFLVCAYGSMALTMDRFEFPYLLFSPLVSFRAAEIATVMSNLDKLEHHFQQAHSHSAKKDIVAVGALDSPELPASIDCLTQPACIAQVALLCACICSDRAKQLRLTLDACSFLHSGTIGSKWLPLS